MLELYNSNISTLTAMATAAPQATLAVWTDLSADDGTSAIMGRQAGGEPFVVSPAGEAFQGLPQVARQMDGYLIVWHAESLDGSLLGVFGQRFDAAGRPLGDRFQVNEESEGDQRDPVVATDALGNAVVVWSSFGQDGDRGTIVGRRFDRHGWPQGDELVVNEIVAGHQERPLVGFDPSGTFVVAWSTRGGDGEAPASVKAGMEPVIDPLG